MPGDAPGLTVPLLVTLPCIMPVPEIVPLEVNVPVPFLILRMLLLSPVIVPALVKLSVTLRVLPLFTLRAPLLVNPLLPGAMFNVWL